MSALLHNSLYNSKLLELACTPRQPIAGAVSHIGECSLRCGDRVKVQAQFADGRITRLAHKTRGCSVCKASAQLLCAMYEGSALSALDILPQVRAEFELYIHGGTPDWIHLTGYRGEIEEVFPALRNYPDRIPCALLPWDALKALKANVK